MNLSLKSLEAARASVTDVLESGLFDQIENGERFRDQYNEIVANIDGMSNMVRDLAEAQESLMQGGWSQEWYDHMNKDGNFEKVCPMDKVPIFGGPNARTEACMESIGESISKFAQTMLEYLKKFLNWLIDKGKWLYDIWRKHLRSRVFEHYGYKDTGIIKKAMNEFKQWEDQNKIYAQKLASIKAVVPDVKTIADQQRVVVGCFKAVKAADMEPGSDQFNKMVRSATIQSLNDSTMFEYFRSLVNVKLSEMGLQSDAQEIYLNKGAFHFPDISNIFRERTVELSWTEADGALLKYCVTLGELINNITATQNVFSEKMADLNKAIADLGKRHRDMVTGKTGSDKAAEKLSLGVKSLSSWSKLLASLLKREGEMMTACINVRKVLSNQMDAALKAAELPDEVTKVIRTKLAFVFV